MTHHSILRRSKKRSSPVMIISALVFCLTAGNLISIVSARAAVQSSARYGPWSATYDDAVSSVQCQPHEVMTGCDCHSWWGSCDGARIVDGNNTDTCNAYNRYNGSGVYAVAVCMDAPPDWEARTVIGGTSGGWDDATSAATCAFDEVLTSCACHSWYGTCDGAIPNLSQNTCYAFNSRSGGGVNAVARCVRTTPEPSTQAVVGNRSGKSDDAKSMVTCPGGMKLAGCSCHSWWGSCDGAHPDPAAPQTRCLAYNGYGGQGVDAHAICLDVEDRSADPSDFWKIGWWYVYAGPNFGTEGGVHVELPPPLTRDSWAGLPTNERPWVETYDSVQGHLYDELRIAASGDNGNATVNVAFGIEIGDASQCGIEIVAQSAISGLVDVAGYGRYGHYPYIEFEQNIYATQYRNLGAPLSEVDLKTATPHRCWSAFPPPSLEYPNLDEVKYKQPGLYPMEPFRAALTVETADIQAGDVFVFEYRTNVHAYESGIDLRFDNQGTWKINKPIVSIISCP